MDHPPLVLEDVLYVGQRVFFYPDPHRKASRNIDGVIRGWQRDGYILLELNEERSRPSLLRPGSACSTRFLKEGMACAIESVVLDSQFLSGRPTVRVAWSGRVRAVSLRRAERIEVTIPCTLHDSDGDHRGQVCNLSTGGLGIVSTVTMEAGHRLALSCRLPDGAAISRLPLVVRNLRREADGQTLVGCAFEEESERDAQAVGFYVTSTLLRQRGAPEERPVVLILDDDALTTAVMQKRLNDFGCDCEVYGNLLDGVFRARLRAPTTILMRFGWGDLTALEVCRLFRSGPSLGSTVVLVYGEGAEANAAALLQAGASGLLATLERPNEVLEYIRTHVPQLAAG